MPVSLFLVDSHLYFLIPAGELYIRAKREVAGIPLSSKLFGSQKGSCPLLHRFLRVMGCRRHFPYRRLCFPRILANALQSQYRFGRS
jgi:hypothetical protein